MPTHRIAAIVDPLYDPFVLSYRHAFHAGNHADVLKHIVLATSLEYLGRKAKPYFYVDTHAGAGSYMLNEGHAATNQEWVDGIERILTSAPNGLVPSAVRDYLDTIIHYRELHGDHAYPGSPAIAETKLRAEDKAFLFELHPSDHSILERNFARDSRFKVRREDGLSGIRSVLPPPSRRGLVFIDPSYELKTDYDRIVSAVDDAIHRFATGVYIIWYPLLEKEEARELPERLLALYGGTRFRGEFCVQSPRKDGWGMRGSGIVAFNPPWILRSVLEESLPYLTEALGEDPGKDWMLRWYEEGEA